MTGCEGCPVYNDVLNEARKIGPLSPRFQAVADVEEKGARGAVCDCCVPPGTNTALPVETTRHGVLGIVVDGIFSPNNSVTGIVYTLRQKS